MSHACKACAFFEGQAEASKASGRCHFNPPLASAEKSALWPTVSADDWCSRFESQVK